MKGGFAVGVLAGAVSVILAGVLLAVLSDDAAPTADLAQVRPLLDGVDFERGIPRADSPQTLLVLVTHNEGTDAAIARMFTNARRAGWEVQEDSWFVDRPGLGCASLYSLDRFLSADSWVAAHQAVREAALELDAKDTALVVVSTEC